MTPRNFSMSPALTTAILDLGGGNRCNFAFFKILDIHRGVSPEISMSVVSIPFVFCKSRHRRGVTPPPAQGVSPEISMSVAPIPFSFYNSRHGVDTDVMSYSSDLCCPTSPLTLYLIHLVAVSLSVRLVGLVPCPSLCSVVV